MDPDPLYSIKLRTPQALISRQNGPDSQKAPSKSHPLTGYSRPTQPNRLQILGIGQQNPRLTRN